MSLTVPHSQMHLESSLVLGIPMRSIVFYCTYKYEERGLVEINMFLKINKHFIPTNPAEVAPLDKKMNWENNIPKRLVMALYDGGEKKDTDDDNDNSLV
jgi:hypothetical protein